MEKSVKSNAVNLGLYLAIILSLYTVIGYVVNLELLINFWMIFLVLPIIILIFGIYTIGKTKKLQDGFASFKEAFSSYFITVAVGIFVSTLVSFILFNFIDPEAALELKEIALEKSAEMMKSFGAPPEQIAQQIEAAEKKDTQSLKSQVLQLAQSLVFFTILGLIVAAIMKKNRPETE
ncbi:DUF4199 domain-containing protein [Seonamhaeicola sp. ML3]|uniref:DUF4199 domain-containing protein n=1 Tax=Seonamhaeicola sp. ML3 TaxID=2937786 RepID=UPI00200E1902|nr:DUF4199 domain-containing protein [Seonamhaeicola sp. ML3]